MLDIREDGRPRREAATQQTTNDPAASVPKGHGSATQPNRPRQKDIAGVVLIDPAGLGRHATTKVGAR